MADLHRAIKLLAERAGAGDREKRAKQFSANFEGFSKSCPTGVFGSEHINTSGFEWKHKRERKPPGDPI